MSCVYLLMKHPPHPFATGRHLKASEVVGVYAEFRSALAIAAEKNKRNPRFLWRVARKQVKG